MAHGGFEMTGTVGLFGLHRLHGLMGWGSKPASGVAGETTVPCFLFKTCGSRVLCVLFLLLFLLKMWVSSLERKLPRYQNPIKTPVNMSNALSPKISELGCPWEPSATIKAVFSSLGLKYTLESTRAHVLPTELGDFNFDPSLIVGFLVSVYNLYNYKG